ncbi:autotransporter domain-containing protein [Segnochrobactrum spirostomi]|nr:autotransporter domain-containing protein [Segnochrobactrum spirostomi]
MFWLKREESRRGSKWALRASTCAIALTLCGALQQAAHADTVYWDGPANGNWFVDSNWIWDGHVPTAADTARIDSAGPLIATSTTGSVGTLQIGTNGTGTLTVQGGLNSGTATLGYNTSSEGTLTVSGGTWTNSGSLYVGYAGIGTVALTNGATATSGATYLGAGGGGSGTITVSGGSSFASTGTLFIGYAGNGGMPSAAAGSGTLTVTGGSVTSAGATLADGLGSTGQATLSGGTSQWTNTGALVVGGGGIGTLSLDGGASLSTDSLTIGSLAAVGSSRVTVDGSGSHLTSTGSLIVGNFGTGSLAVQAGGRVSADGAIIGRHSDSSAVVTGSGSTWTTGNLQVGGDVSDPTGTLGHGTLTVSNGGEVVSTAAQLGAVAGAQGTVIVDGAGSLWQVNGGSLSVGFNGTGDLTIRNGASVSSSNATIGSNAASQGSATVAGTGSHWTSSGNIYVGNGGNGSLSVENGGVVSAVDGYVATLTGSTSSLSVTGANAAANFSGVFIAGYSTGTVATVTLSNGGQIRGVQGTLGDLAGSSGTMSVSGRGSQWSAFVDTNVSYSGYMNVGRLGTGSLSITDGGAVTGYRLYIGNEAGSVGSVVLSGSGSRIEMTSNLYVGSEGTGTLTLSDGAEIHAAAIKIGYLAGSVGTLNIGAAAGRSAAAAGTLDAAEIVLGDGDSRLVLNHTDTDYGIAANITGSGTLLVLSGTTALTGTNTYTGGTTITAGTLQIGNGGTTGSIAGDVTDNGTLAFNRADDVTFAGVISGTGALVQAGSGTLTLTGANTYSGGTTVSAGTLVGNATSLQGNIANNAAVVFNQTGNGTYAAAISGTGSMTKTGAGTLILIGENTYTGGTTISEGTLQIGNGGTTGALVGAIVNNAALVFNRSDTYNFPGTISGPGSVTIIGGTVNFTGANSYAGPISVADATFELAPGAVSASSYTIGFGGVIGGTGTIGGLSVLDGGTASPGYSPGTLTVNGNVTFGSGSIYRVDVYANGAHDLITATGTATISGGTVEVIAQNGYSTPLATYTILTAQGGVSGQFASVVSNFAFLTPSLTYDANDVYLTLARNDVSFPSLATTTNQWAAANAAQSLGLGNAVYDAVLAVSTSGAPAAFDALSGEAYASASSVMQQQSSYLREAVGTRVRQGLIGQSGSGQETAKLAPGYDATVWTQAYGAWGQTAGDGNAASVDRTIGGFFTGIDAAVSEAARVGIVGGYSRSTFNVDARSSSGDIDNYDLGLYGGAKFGSLSLTAAASYTWHDLSVDRTIAFPGFSGIASANYQAGTTQVFGEAAWRVDLSKSVDAKTFGAASVEPFANLAYVNLSTQNLTEAGTPAALTGSAETENTLYSTLGVRAATVFQMANGAALTPHASLGWQHAFGDVNSSASLAFASGGSAFSVAGVPIARDAALVGAGVDYAFSKSVSASVTYSGQFGSGTEDNAFKGTINIKF